MKNVTETKSETATVPAERPKLNLVEIEKTASRFENEGVDFPDDVRDQGRESSGDVAVRWEPKTPGECLIGEVHSINEMKTFGGLAVVFDVSGVKILLTQGGTVFEQKFSDPSLNLRRGSHVAVLYTGLSEAEEGMNPARLWRIKKL